MKVHGSISDEFFPINAEEIRKKYEDNEALFVDLKDELAKRHLVVMGYSAHDSDLRKAYDQYRKSTGDTSPTYVIDPFLVAGLSNMVQIQMTASNFMRFAAQEFDRKGTSILQEAKMGVEVKPTRELRSLMRSKVGPIVVDRQSKPAKMVYVVSGDPGVGKSWLASQVVERLLSNRRVYKVINKDFAFVAPLTGDERKEVKSFPVFVLDDNWISFGRGTNLSTLTDLDTYGILRKLLSFSLEGSNYVGPLLFSVSTPLWNQIVNDVSDRHRMPIGDHLRNYVAIKSIEGLTSEESEAMIKYLSKEMPGLTFEDWAVNAITRASQGNLMILTLFFNTTIRKKWEEARGHYTVTKNDALEIDPVVESYVLKKLLDLYFPIEGASDCLPVFRILLLVAISHLLGDIDTFQGHTPPEIFPWLFFLFLSVISM